MEAVNKLEGMFQRGLLSLQDFRDLYEAGVITEDALKHFETLAKLMLESKIIF